MHAGLVSHSGAGADAGWSAASCSKRDIKLVVLASL
jgi:hypothetical protein